ncbi:hypothetical protein ACTOB_003523 [Actinoplanes oblitus]|uniref:Uncharacterized protein n=1 Tax=Actinoplanes oblitus TaxID=3040509 RepID=A0ABY8WQY2_9ACTN|nr:hypothetical protein [Actinoplanes oblitus]WIM99857.1 hypothetical protein ACTOB_003523 [Actinoplanes oblitus]
MTEVGARPAARIRLTGPEDIRAAEEWRRWIVGPDQELRRFVRQLVEQGDTERLLALYRDTAPLHEFLAETAPTHGPGADGLGPPFRAGEPALISAIRTQAAAGLAVLHPDDEQYPDAAGRWAQRAFPTARTNDATVPALPRSVPEDLRALLGSRTGPAAHLVTAMILDLSGHLPPPGDTAAVAVLLKTGSQGLAATLSVALRPELPHRLVPDPARMALGTVDQDFQDAMEAAWTQTRAHRLDAGVTWAVESRYGPVPRLADRSLGLAFTLVLAELVRRRQRLRQLLRWQRLQPRTTAIGRVDGALVRGVDGYREKLRHADPHFATLVPAEDVGKLGDVPHQADIVPVATVRQALRRGRRRDRKALVRTLAVVATAVLLAAGLTGYGYLRATRDAENTRLTALADKVAAAARSSPGTDGQDLLLAMASDDIAARAGGHPSVFDRLSQDRGSLVKIYRPDTGAFRDATLSGSGRLAVLTGDAGTIRLIDTGTREVVWSKNLPPGMTFAPGQVFATAAAVTDDGIAAIGLSDRRILLVERTREGWREDPPLTVPGTDQDGLFGSRAVTALAFDGDASYLYAAGRHGVRRYSLDARHTLITCAAGEDVQSIEATGAGLLMTLADRVVTVAFPRRCASTTVLRAPAGVTLRGSGVVDKTRVAAGTIGAKLVTVGAHGIRSTIAEDGPYETVRVSDSYRGWRVASTGKRTGHAVMWALDDGTVSYNAGASGNLWAGGRLLVWIHDGLAELHSYGLDSFLTMRTLDDVRAIGARWAGPDLLVRTYTGVYLLRSVTSKPFLNGQLTLPGPEHSVPQQLAGDSTGLWGAAVFLDDDTHLRRLTVWNLHARQEVFVPTPAGDIPIVAQFVGDRLYVGYGNGALRVFGFGNGSWTMRAEARYTDPILDLAASADGRTVAGMSGRTDKGSPAVFTVEASSLRLVDRRVLSGPSGLAHLTVLHDGRIVAAYGAGTVVFLRPDLTEIRTDLAPQMNYVTAVAEVPQRREVVVGSSGGSRVFDTGTGANVSAHGWGRSGATIDLAADRTGEMFASVEFNSAQIAIWSMAPGVRRANACAAIGRDLTEAEWAQFVGPDLPYQHVC